jgi:outer membrane protein OmpA-like peptidoglycan-associated protein
MAKYAKSLKDAPVNIDIIPVTEVNSSSAEYRPKLNAEETVMYFTSRRAVGSNSQKDDNGEYYEDIYMSEKHHNVWTEPVLVNDVINTQENSSCLYLSPDAQRMYLYMYNTDKTKGPLGGKIFESKLEGQKWTEPLYLDNTINSKYRETDASLDIYGNIAFFTSDREGGYGGRDIWMMKKLPSGEWAEAQNLGETVNTEYDEEGPYLHPDGKTLYFSSKGHKVMGGFDFFKTELRVDGTWSIPENLGYPINTVGDDLFFFPSVNGKRAYFSSYRGDGLGNYDLYRINLVQETESDLAVYKGVVKDSSGNVVKDLVISIFDENRDDKYGIYRPNELTGRFLFILQPGHDYEIVYELNNITTSDSIVVPSDPVGIIEYTKVVTVGTDDITLSAGVVVDGDIVSIAMLNDMDIQDLSINDEKSNVEINNNVTSSDNVIIDETVKPDPVIDSKRETHVEFYENVYFKYESAELSSSVTDVLDDLLVYLKKNPLFEVNTVGHTDSKGADDYNNKLSIIRANAVKTYLTNRGIDFHRVHAYGEGENNPLAENYNPDGSDNPVGREANRRVEVQLIK